MSKTTVRKLCTDMLNDLLENEEMILETFPKLPKVGKDEFIYKLVEEGYTQVELGRILGKSQATIYNHTRRHKERISK